uniref:28S ribosomal protein S6, mitochondrial n=1 Tax=Rhabditophanes sp. KR3021 TaxID=114890 RepID=A0AC35THJ1_9BILA
MPLYEVTLIARNLAKPDLYKALHRSATLLLDNGAVITEMKSLGVRDLPYKRLSRQTKEPVYSSNYFFMKSYMPIETQRKALSILVNDLDLLHVHFVNTKILETPSFECNLEDILKPPAQRQSVQDLKDNQKVGHFTRQMIYKRTEKEWKSVPKSYPIPPPRE